jgi:hypothetical protein
VVGKGRNNALMFQRMESECVFVSVVIVAFQIGFCVKIQANDFFLFFKNYF